MGAGASSEHAAKLKEMKTEEVTEALKALPAEDLKKIQAALAAPAAAKPKNIFNFASGLPDCCMANPDQYKIVAELPGARMVEMTLPAGQEDKKHDHPIHYMYVVKGGKLKLSPPPGQTEGEAEIELPDGAPPIIPPGAHQVKNVGDTDVKIIFVEPYPICQPCGDVPADFISPLTVAPKCYHCLAEDDDWFTGMVTMEPGEEDGLHHHRDHFIYMLEGDQITLYPGGDKEKGKDIPIEPMHAVAAPIAAGDIFAKHIMKNSGTKPCKLIFFETKK
eukprot:TRINITY_DN10364_c3_g1_i2.p1 TRINITY_DN10364_c3_g1~~TRINITY_DN10364_c3_g1_i2.p1  ORF type:complete len:276 (-),score=89.83 TRINITY_DN10364_c3_g1_i2:259-1086(-)